MNLKLTDLKPGQEAIIMEFDKNDFYLKLIEMGCLPGEKITMEKIAPLGGPISFNVSGYSLSLRQSEADQIFVELIN
jgi:ferrous iron transport protein A